MIWFRKVDQGLECAFNYTARCFSKRQKEIHRKSLSGAVQVIGDLCTPGAFRQSINRSTVSFNEHNERLKVNDARDGRNEDFFFFIIFFFPFVHV